MGAEAVDQRAAPPTRVYTRRHEGIGRSRLMDGVAPRLDAFTRVAPGRVENNIRRGDEQRLTNTN